ncbi:prolipoprotein diacylglyceryl transferase [Candidatus Blochmannia ocreatus (nom. nud.)]|uniref:Phosphatidylglycerol--prolipoprotein diacylglyceryl transferase n=1 Tax=Candidatus Blochmannia ocreatus (nom. nud.) TaxID=251538 RepID=A0ABY4STW7_9ENTR|nr:prolipoprotein diacylglyceryl transferase [Candidatus Blochmannia ocreatus]URJ25331.1 prolipoprotein diacylglyceryl transferase [Candidatus Blochmannia ocreatus]
MYYYHELNPIIFSIGPISLYWYGMMYVLSFIYAIRMITYHNINYSNNIFLNYKDLENLLCLCFLGILLGGRAGYVLFYQWSFFSQHLLKILNIWEGGMSFHGGLIGVITAIKIFSYKKQKSFLMITDIIVPTVPFGLGCGRLGNFINGELWGRVTTDVPWAMFFPKSINQDLISLNTNYSTEWQELFDMYGALPRHPSQLYEMFLEGIILHIIINKLTKKFKPTGYISGLFLISYGILRITAEFFREPDEQIGLFINTMTLGQILSCPMIIIGFVITCGFFRPKN